MAEEVRTGATDDRAAEEANRDTPAAGEPAADSPSRPSVKVEDRRFWARAQEAEEPPGEVPPSPYPTLVEELKRRAEEAERTLREYVDAYKQAQAEHEEARARLLRDVDRRVEERFAALVSDLLECLDDLDLALKHAAERPEARPLFEGVALARDRFLAALGRHGVVRLELEGTPFDPNVAEAIGVEPVEDPDRVGRVVRVERAGYKVGDRLLRAARVVVGQRPN